MTLQYKAFWSIPEAGPSVSTFHFYDGTNPPAVQTIANAVRAFFAAFPSLIPEECAVSFDSEVVRINTATGVLEESFPVIEPAVVAGTSSAAWAAGTGARVQWLTDRIINGKRVRGATFIVPLHSTSFTGTGRVSGATITTLNNAGAALISATGTASHPLSVWSRPTDVRPGDRTTVLTASTSATPGTLRTRKY